MIQIKIKILIIFLLLTLTSFNTHEGISKTDDKIGESDKITIAEDMRNWNATYTETALTGDKPEARFSTQMVYDSGIEKFVLFGGHLNLVLGTNDTWIFDPITETWAEQEPLIAPTGRLTHGMVYDEFHEVTIIFGGQRESNEMLNDTWAYDSTANTWTNLNPPSAPSIRMAFSMFYDPVSHKIVLVGGYKHPYDPDVWVYDYEANTWTEIVPDPALTYDRLQDLSMFYDEAGARILAFGGFLGVDGFSDDFWEFDLVSESWTLLETKGDIKPGYGEVAVDNNNNSALLVISDTVSVGTFILDLINGSWIEIDIPNNAAGKYFDTIAYDPLNDYYLFFGGSIISDGDRIDDTWKVELTETEYIPPTDDPTDDGDEDDSSFVFTFFFVPLGLIVYLRRRKT